MEIRENALIRRVPGPVETTVGTEIVLMTLAAGECIGLGETGSEVWRQLSEPTTFAALTAKLRQTYEAPPEVLEHDVRNLLRDLQKKGLIELT